MIESSLFWFVSVVAGGVDPGALVFKTTIPGVSAPGYNDDPGYSNQGNLAFGSLALGIFPHEV